MRAVAVAFVIVSALVLAAAAGAATPRPQTVTVSAAACSPPPARFQTNPIATGAWIGTCVGCRAAGPRAIARANHLPSSSRTVAAHWYATKSPAFRQFKTLLGGAATTKALVYDACLTGFRVRGRP